MAYEIGTATNLADLYSKFITFVTTGLGADNWSMVHGYEHADGSITGSPVYVSEDSLENKIILKGNGAGGTDEIYVGLSTYRNTGEDDYAIQGRAYIGYDDTRVWDTQPFQHTGTPCILLWDGAMPYWFVANGRRFIMVVKVNTTYQIFYGGFFLPYAFPNEYQYPYIVGGMSNDVDKGFFNVDTNNSVFWVGSSRSGIMNLPTNDWKWAGNSDSNVTSGSFGYSNSVSFLPYYVAGITSTAKAYNPMRLMKPALGGMYWLLPIEPCSGLYNESAGIFGALDGVHYISGFNNSPENTLVIDAKNYVVFTNASRVDTEDYFALRLD